MAENQTTCSVRQDLSFDIQYSPLVNFAMQQNHVPIIRRLLIKNESPESMDNLALTLAGASEFVRPYTKQIMSLPAQTDLDVGLVDLQLQPEFLAGLTERLAGEIRVSLDRADGSTLLKKTMSLDVLAFDEWGGAAVLPELLCAFVTPNHPAIADILVQAAVFLKQWTGDPSLDGYQRKEPNRVRQQAAAIYGALQARQIVYCLPPASFEQNGQRIRLADVLLEKKMGTCLDLTLLYAACLEAAGLNPVLNIIKDHAFAGVWLTDTCFPETLQDDVSLLAKQTAAGIQDLLLVETTAFVAGKSIPFDDAEKLALQHLRKEDDFICLIDIRRARASGIRPLPQRILKPGGWTVRTDAAEPGITERPEPAAPADLEIQARLKAVDAAPPMTRQKQWERKLLDLSLRNTLLNFRLTKNTVRLFARQLAHLEDLLSNGTDFQVLERPADWLDDPRDPRSFENQFNLDPYEQLLEFEFQQKRLRTPLDAADLLNAMTGLYRSARSSLEENGANTLYLALGFLRWYETDISQQPRYAPLVLIPVDLIRRSVSKGYMIRNRDEEPQVNITLLELLRQDFGLTISGLDPLPRDENGVDVKAVLNIFRQAVLQRPRWTVLDEAYLGIFSFTQFIMWYDIRNRADDLAKNRVVASLMAGKLSWQPKELLPPDLDLDELYDPEQTFLPISADASQLAAIHAAGEGQSFVLHGPPGTGKSQTITNLIANALARGKTVLFVAEKMAALTVVQRRLEAIGLGPFCLELHSNKSRKKDVLEQLRLASEIARTGPPEGYARQAGLLHELRGDLSAYVRRLYRTYPFGLNLFEAISRFGELSDAAEGVILDTSVFADLEQSQVDQWFALTGDLQAAARDIGRPYRHPLADLAVTQWSQSAKSAAAAQLPQYLEALAEAARQTETIRNLLQLPGCPEPGRPAVLRRQAENLQRVCRQIAALPDLPPVLLTAPDLAVLAGQLDTVCGQGQVMTAAQAALAAVFRDSVFDESGETLLTAWRQYSQKGFLPRLMGQLRLGKRLKQHLKPGCRLAAGQIESLLQHLAHHQNARRQIDRVRPLIPGQLDGYWQDLTTDWAAGRQYAACLPELAQAMETLTGDCRSADRLALRFSEIMSGRPDREKLAVYLQTMDRQAQLQQQLAALLAIDFSALSEEDIPNEPSDPAAAAEPAETDRTAGSWYIWLMPVAKGWLDNLAQLREWCVWRTVRGRACEAGLTPLVTALEQGVFGPDEGPAAFARAFYQAAATWIIEQDPALNAFSGQLFEEKIRRFKQNYAQFEQMTQKELYARLAAGVPRFDLEAAASSELGILQRAIKSNGRALSIRRLFELIPNLLPRLTPCMLMSPISVAQYLDPGQTLFDLVVFDEASQMPTCEAVGAMARGREVVVVGDPRQLPPTSFFAIDNTDEEHFDTEDLESVLDDCLALSMPQMHLLWHYRSRHESLIAFSNRQYYENKLLTFPSPSDLVSRVRLVPVDGVYDRGRSKQNRIEAQAVVDEIVRRLQDPLLGRQSIGVVTFNTIQQNLIDDLLTDVFRERPDLEEKATQGIEPVFIKNLENVQGDERDVILFSIGYGPDKNGRVSLNFGPLNREGGWRRLNVAASRARNEMMVFSTIQPEQLDITRTSALGVAGLKAFLEYARRGRQGLPVSAAQTVMAQTPGIPAADSAGLAAQVAAALEENGYPTQLLVGSSGYRIDLGVIHPDRPGEYILGILCNGATYRNARTTRDREVLQMSILQQLGWQLHQIWAVDWWENPAKEIRRLLQRLEVLRHETADALPVEAAARPAVQPSAQPAAELPAVNRLAQASPPPVGQTGREPSVKPPAADGRPYVITGLSFTPLSLEAFLLPKNTGLIAGKMQAILKAEAPISRLLLFKRLLQSCGLNRLSPRLEQKLDQVLAAGAVQMIRHDDLIFCWLPDQNPTGYCEWRQAEDDAARRQPEDLPPEEIAALVRQILRRQIGMPRTDLIREGARMLGYSRMGAAIDRVFRQGIDLALEWGWAADSRNDGGYLSAGT
ncbi:MAG: DUF3320 domain-containing protein [Clostridiaceae bacterium]|nr:DUF3320 domain-containing protein [Clostridiaceae bacterium]